MSTQTSVPFSSSEEKASDSLIRTMKDDLESLKDPSHHSAGTNNTKEHKPAKPVSAPVTNKKEVPQNLQKNPFSENVATEQQAPLKDEFKPATETTPSQTPQPKEPSQLFSDFAEVQKRHDAGSVTTKSEPEITEIPADILLPEKTHSGLKVFLITIISLLAIGLIIAGGYVVLFSKKAPTNQQPPAQQETTQSEEKAETAPQEQDEQVTITTPTEKYTDQKPNYLAIDIATLSQEEIKNVLVATKEEVGSLTGAGPYEFIVVDANNNPISFPIFATATKLNLSKNVLASLGENFSLFYVKDVDNVHLGISIATKDHAALQKAIKDQEKTFATDASLLFLNETPNIKPGSFNDSTYNGHAIRYLNLNNTQTLSVDYTITDSALVVGTSKNTLRSILDIKDTPKNTPAPQTSNASTPLTEDINPSSVTQENTPTSSTNSPASSQTPTILNN